jgi:hypothetical protein
MRANAHAESRIIAVLAFSWLVDRTREQFKAVLSRQHNMRELKM